MEREIVVRGEGEVRVMPDRLTVRVVADGEGVTRDEAYGAAARTAAAVDEVFAAHADAFARVQTTALVVQPRVRWTDGEQVRTGWDASRTSSVEIRALERSGDLLAALSGAGGSVSALSWEVDPGHEAHRRVRQEAARDARARAEDYAAALGANLGRLAWVAEPGLRSGGGGPPSPMRVFAAAAPGPGGAQPSQVIETHPEEITLTAAVEIGFAIGPG